jgi:hypothetical protein
MAISIREQLLAAITLAVGGEYSTEIPTDERELPITLVTDDVESATGDYDETIIELPVAIARAAATVGRNGDEHRTQANALLAGIVTETFIDTTFGGLAQNTEYTGGGIALNSTFVAAEAQFTVTFSHVRGDPYTLS